MTEIKRAITVEQWPHANVTGKFIYRVLKLKNMLQPGIRDVLDHGAVEELINSGIEVTIIGRK